MKRPGKAQRLAEFLFVLAVGVIAASAASGAEEQAAVPTADESPILTATGVLVSIERSTVWPRLEIQVHDDQWMLELPSTVTLAWLQGRPVDLDSLKPGQPIKVLYTLRKKKKRVRSVQILGGVIGSGGQAGGKQPPGSSMPVVPRMPELPRINIQTPSLPTAPAAPTTEAPVIPSIPSIPTVDPSRRSR